MAAPVDTSGSRRVYAPVGECIYCRSTLGLLSIEHIFPRSLKGNWELPEASCSDCAVHTGGAEQIIARPTLGIARAKLGFKTRKPKERPRHATIYVGPRGKEKETLIPINEHPTLFAMPLLPPAGILSSGEQPSSNLWRPKYKAIINRDEVRKLLAGYNEDVVVSVGRQNAHVWCRVLAKIAHSYTVAECGINSFRPYLLDIILGRPVVSAFYWIGGDMENHVREPHIHTAAMPIPLAPLP